MIYLFLVACILLAVGEIWRVAVTKKRYQQVLDYIQTQQPEVYAARFSTLKVGDHETTLFFQSPENLGDPTLGELKKKAVSASKVGMMPLLVMIAAMAILYVYGAVASFF